ncbi:MAG: hypothetical protein V4736_15000 [Bdellovibrionota bacterium]
MKLAVIFSMLIFAKLVSADPLTAEEITQRLQVNADIYVMDATGTKVIGGPERTNFWRPNPDTRMFESNWSSDLRGTWSSTTPTGGLIAFKHKWTINDDGSIKVSIEQYAEEDNKTFKNLIDKKEFILTSFEPITWKITNIKTHNFVVRFVPTLREVYKPLSFEGLPIASKNISITDTNGYLWANELEFNGKYAGVTTHRGTLVLSYSPFDGAKEIGVSEGKTITVNIDKKYKITLRGDNDFLPAGVVAKVFAIYVPGKKSKGFNAVHSFETSKTDRIKEVLSN